MRRSTIVLGLQALVGSALTSTSALAGAQLLPVTNSGFESPVFGPCAFGTPATGWTVDSGGVWHVLPCWAADYPDGAPEGLQVAYSNGGDIAQVLTSTLQSMIEYTLSVEVGRRGNCCPMQGYRVQLLASGTLLVEDPGALDPVPGTFETSIISFVAGTDHPALGQPLEIRLVREGLGQANFDDVRLETGPADCNDNGVLDSIDIANGISEDENNNGVPDECESPASCPADIAPAPGGNGAVNVDDLLAVINGWGTCANPNNCPADIAPQPNGDGFVNVDDLLAIINGWGTCP